MSYEQNSKTLKLAEDIVYVGGITTFLYVDVNIADEMRPTYDVDFVIDTSKRKEYDLFQQKLRSKGFTHDTSPGAPICRFKYGEELIIDAMPSDESVLGFSNSWYKEGIKFKEKVRVEGKEINILPLQYFIASKFEAFNGRRKSEPRMSNQCLTPEIQEAIAGFLRSNNEKIKK